MYHSRVLSCAQARVLAYWSSGKVPVRSCGITQVGAISVLEVKRCEHSLLQFFALILNRQKGMNGVLLKVESRPEKQQKQRRLEELASQASLYNSNRLAIL